MSRFLLTYDLAAHKTQDRLIDELARMGAKRCALSAWFLEQDTTAHSIRDSLADFVEEDDHMIVVAFDTAPASWNMLEHGVSWMEGRYGKWTKRRDVETETWLESGECSQALNS